MSGKGYLILDHPADLGIEAYGESLAQAFQQAAVALMSIILDLATVGKSESRNVRISADDPGQLLVKWLGEVLYLYDGQGFAGREFSISTIGTTYLEATIYGEMYRPGKHKVKMDVKAVTYHQLEVGESEKGARVRVFLDV